MKFLVRYLFLFILFFLSSCCCYAVTLQKVNILQSKARNLILNFVFDREFILNYKYFYLSDKKLIFVIKNNINIFNYLKKKDIVSFVRKKNRFIIKFNYNGVLKVCFILVKNINHQTYLSISLKIINRKINNSFSFVKKKTYIIKNHNKHLSSNKIIKSHIINKFNNVNKIKIAIDAGHGGYDPGAVTLNGIKEKDINLSISKKLLNYLNLNKNLNAFLVRDKDIYLSLKERFNVIKKSKADLFVSIHTDSTINTKVYGASVWLFYKDYFLFRNSNMNINHLILYKNYQKIINIKKCNKNYISYCFALELLKKLIINNIHLHKIVPQFNNLIVLSTKTPSVLIETGYLSNPYESKKLNNNFYQHKLAKYISLGIISFIKKIKI